ncbi:MAG: membrane dipeptidase [candidate division Zixibacteria bacterium]|nr:membrane dipeptidase [candidate division Zixibacteria bacterium]
MNRQTDISGKMIFTADLHCDTVLQMIRGYDISKRHKDYHIDIPRLIDGGVDLQVFASLAHKYKKGKSEFDVVNDYINCLKTEFAKNSNNISICHTANQAIQANKDKKIAAVLAIEGGTALTNDFETIGYFYNRGIRLLTLVHEQSTNWCISWSDKNPTFNGITKLGREIIAEMNRMGMIIDISHCEVSSANEVIKESRLPVVASHSCANSLCSSGRSMKDDQIKALADKGGVIGVTFIYFVLSQELNRRTTELREKYPNEIKKISELFVSTICEDKLHTELKKHASILAEFESFSNPQRTSVKTVVDHIDYIINLGGIECVAIGSDFDGMSNPPLGLEDCTGMPNITNELLERGYKENEVKKIMGGNFMRLFKDVCG